MWEIIMKQNYAKAFKRVAIAAALLALFSAAAVPLSLFRQIQDLTAWEQTMHEQPARQQDQISGEHHALDREELWKSQITPLSAASYAILGGTAAAWLALLAWYWLLVMAWLRKSAVSEGMNKSLWPILGLFTNLLAVFAFLIVRDNPHRARSAANQ